MSSFNLQRSVSSPALSIGVQRVQEAKTEAPAKPVQKLPPPTTTAAQQAEKPTTLVNPEARKLFWTKSSSNLGARSASFLPLSFGPMTRDMSKEAKEAVKMSPHSGEGNGLSDAIGGTLALLGVHAAEPPPDPHGLAPAEHEAVQAHAAKDHKSVGLAARAPASAVDQALYNVSQELHKELDILEKKYPGETPYFSNPNDKEKLDRLRVMKRELDANPDYFRAMIKEHSKEPLYTYMQPLKFLSILAKSDDNIRKTPDQHGLTALERVAVYGYTTGDYMVMNRAARPAKGKAIEDPGMQAYVESAKSGMKKLPDASIPTDAQGQEVNLKRAIFTIPTKTWVKDMFKIGKDFVDYGFASTTKTLEQQGQVNITFIAPAGSKTIPHAKVLGEPYSAWPGEAETVFEPGTRFKVKSVKEPTLGGAASVQVALQCYSLDEENDIFQKMKNWLNERV